MTLAELLRAAPALRVAGATDIQINELRHDSREVVPGDLFFALPGSKTDGNRHIRQALDKGAVAVFSELEPPPPPAQLPVPWVEVDDIAPSMGLAADAFFGHPSSAMTVIGVTGTNGKTTTTYFLEAIVTASGGRPAVAGTVDVRCARTRLEKSLNTTPISLSLLRWLARFRQERATHALLEISSHALALKRAETLDFDACIFLNLNRDHLDFHKSLDRYFEAKTRLFDLLARADNKKAVKVAAINFDDPRGHLLVKHAIGCDVVRFGRTTAATDLRAEILSADLLGTRLQVTWRGRSVQTTLQLPGPHNVENALAAAAAMLGLGTPLHDVLNGLSSLRSVPGRLEGVAEGQDFHVFIDYAHTDGALEAVLRLLAGLPHRRIITVFGCGGERDQGKRGPMGAAACRESDFVILTNDNPRGEDPAGIFADIESGIRAAGLENYKIVPDRASAIETAIAQAVSGDVVLIAGKGHEDHQILRERVVVFDDASVARAALKKRIA